MDAQAVPVIGTYQNGDGGQVTELQERILALEWALESMDWRQITAQAEQEFSRQGLRIITELARVMYLKNPLIKRGVNVQRLYVFGQGFTVRGEQEEIDAALTVFYADPKNTMELSHQEMQQKEIELQISGNLFFAFFVNQVSGRVRVRTMPFEEITDTITNPEDAKTVRFYRRSWTEVSTDMTTGAVQMTSKEAYHPDWRYQPRVKPPTIGGIDVRWDAPVFHVKTGGFSNWRFGISEIYAAIDWAKAYKEFLEDWASIVRAYRRFAFQLSQPGGKTAVMAAKDKLATTTGTDGALSKPPVVGSTFIAGEGVNIQPVRTSGATVAAEDGRRLLLMVAAAVGLPETFFGDSSVGTLATAKSLDRPTELAMRDRQMLWSDVLQQIHAYVLLWAVKAPQGSLRGLGIVKTMLEDNEVYEQMVWADDVMPRVVVEFPPLVQDDAPAMVNAIIDAATLKGQPLAGTVDMPTLTTMLLTTLGVQDVDQVVDRLFPDGTTEAPPATATPTATATEAMMVNAVRELRTTLVRLQEGMEVDIQDDGN